MNSKGLGLVDGLIRFARETPDRVALTTNERSFSYSEVLALAGGLLTRFEAAGFQRGHRVGIVTYKGPEEVLAAISTMAGAGVYVPVHAGWPEERIRWVLGDCDADLIVTTSALRDRALLWRSRKPLVVIENVADLQVSAAHSLQELQPGRGADVAYVMYTSGSTGTPKGVIMQHDAAMNTINAVNDLFCVSSTDAVLGVTRLNFDLSVWDIFGILTCGGRLVLPDEWSHPDPDAWLRQMLTEKVTVWNSVPTLMEILVACAEDLVEPPPRNLRLAMLSGDWISPVLPERISRLFPDCSTVSLGGATEGGIWSIYHEVVAEDALRSSIPYGVALPGQRIDVRDSQGGLAPDGTVGEIWIGGDSLALGYHKREAKTRQQFVVQNSVRFYRTGDGGRRGEHGEVELLGRLDNQVQVGGHRVELGEIESAARASALVKEAVCVDLSDPQSSTVTSLGLVYTTDLRASEDDVRGFLAQRLPDYMVPTALRRVDELPKGGNDKDDRAALSQLLRSNRGDASRSSAGERSTLDQVIAVYKEVLGDHVQADTDFFAAGGQSLLAVRMTHLLRRRLDVRIPVRSVFERSTPRLLATAILRERTTGTSLAGLADPEDLAPAATVQEQVAYLEALEPQSRAYHFQAAVLFADRIDREALEDALTAVVARHEVLRTRFQRGPGGQLVQIVLGPEPVNVDVIDLCQHAWASPEAQAHLDDFLSVRFRVSSPPLFRWAILRCQDVDAIVQVEHHFVHDGWSLNLIWAELSELYAAQQTDGAADLQPLGAQYRDFAMYERRLLEERGEANKTAWSSALSGTQGRVPLGQPGDPGCPPGVGMQLIQRVPWAAYGALSQLAASQGLTTYSLTMSCFIRALSEKVRLDKDFRIGSAVLNRPHEDLLDVIGMMVATVPVPVEVGAIDDPMGLSRRIQERLIWIGEHLPIDQAELVRSLGDVGGNDGSALFNVAFSFHDSMPEDPTLGPHRGGMVELHNSTAKFGLNVIAIPRPATSIEAGANPSDFMRVLWEYNPRETNEAFVLSLMEAFANNLTAVGAVEVGGLAEGV